MISLRKTVPLLAIPCALLLGWVISLNHIRNAGETSKEESPPSEQVSTSEPPMAAALTAQPTIIVREKDQLNFGALVKGDNDLFIELTPDGNIFASGDITGQSQYSHVGAANLSNFSSNRLYRIHPGRLLFDVNSLAENSTVRVEFLDGDLGAGVNLSNLSIDVGAGTSNDLLRLPVTATNKIEFQATRTISQASVDLAFGGRLTLSDNTSGEVNTPMTVKVIVDSPETKALATVYQHINYRGRSLELTEKRKYQIAEITRSIGNDIISSIEVAAGYKIRACEHSNFRGKCKHFTNDSPNLITINFNDVISSLEVLSVN